MSAPVVAVLAYHKVGPPPPGGWETWFYVPEETFARQLDELEEAGFEPFALADLIEALDGARRLPDRGALVTFDDAFRSLRTVAMPLLERRGWPPTVFVPTAYVGLTNEFDHGAEPTEALCDWDDLRALASAGASIQSHGSTHRAFSQLSASERAAELADSRRALERALGARVDAFAYPFGDPGPARGRTARALARAGYRAAFLYGGGPLALTARDRFGLGRIAIGRDTELTAELAR